MYKNIYCKKGMRSVGHPLVGLPVYLTMLFFLLYYNYYLQIILITLVSELSCGCVSSLFLLNDFDFT